MPVDMIERAVKWLDMNAIYNADFKAGVEQRIAELEAKGVDIPKDTSSESSDKVNLLYGNRVRALTDQEVFGPGDRIPMGGRLAPDYASNDDYHTDSTSLLSVFLN